MVQNLKIAESRVFILEAFSTWVVRLKGYNRGLSSTCRKPFSRSIFLRTEAHWPALASQSEALKLKLPFLPYDNIFYKTLHAHTNIMTTNFLFLPVAVLLFTFPPLKSRTLKHPNQNLCKQKEFVYGLKISH